jgi:hypothetical protein
MSSWPTKTYPKTGRVKLYPEIVETRSGNYITVYGVKPATGLIVEADVESAAYDYVIITWPCARGDTTQPGDALVAHYGRIFATGSQSSLSADVMRTLEGERQIVGVVVGTVVPKIRLDSALLNHVDNPDAIVPWLEGRKAHWANSGWGDLEIRTWDTVNGPEVGLFGIRD